MKKLLLALMVIGFFPAYGMDNNPSSVVEGIVAPKMVIKNDTQKFLLKNLKSSYAKWFYSLPSAIQSKIRIDKETQSYALTRENHYLKEICINADVINPSASLVVLEIAAESLPKQLALDSNALSALKVDYDKLLSFIQSSDQATINHLNLLQSYALRIQKYEDRIEFTRWQINKTNSFITWQKKVRDDISQKFSSLPMANSEAALNKSLEACKNEANYLYKEHKKGIGMLKNARNKQETIKALEYLEDIRRNMYVNNVKQELLQKRLRLGEKPPEKEALKITQNAHNTISLEQTEDIGLDYSITTPSSETVTQEMSERLKSLGLPDLDRIVLKEALELTPEDEAIMAKHIEEIRETKRNEPGVYADLALFINSKIDWVVDKLEKNIAPHLSVEAQAKLIASGLEYLFPEMSEPERAIFQDNLTQIIKDGKRLAGLPSEKAIIGVIKGTTNIAKKVIKDPIKTIIMSPGKMVVDISRLIKDGAKLRANMLYYHLVDPLKCRELTDKYFKETVAFATNLHEQLEYLANLTEQDRYALGTELLWETYIFHQSATAQARLAKWLMIQSAQQGQKVWGNFKESIKPQSTEIGRPHIRIEGATTRIPTYEELELAAQKYVGRTLTVTEQQELKQLHKMIKSPEGVHLPINPEQLPSIVVTPEAGNAAQEAQSAAATPKNISKDPITTLEILEQPGASGLKVVPSSKDPIPHETVATEAKTGNAGKVAMTEEEIAAQATHEPKASNSKQSNPPEAKIQKVANMKEFFKNTSLGKTLEENSTKLNQMYNGAKIYRVDVEIGDYLKKGYLYYLDTLHYDHIEVFDAQGRFKCVLNFNGSVNQAKTKQASLNPRNIYK